jgi:hypothetical protein
MLAQPCKVCESVTCYDHCIYCGVDVHLLDHTAECPSMTGLFPVTEQFLGDRCDNCGAYQRRPACPICHGPFELGEFYMRRAIAEDIVMPVCVTCGALNRPLPEDMPENGGSHA